MGRGGTAGSRPPVEIIQKVLVGQKKLAQPIESLIQELRKKGVVQSDIDIDKVLIHEWEDYWLRLRLAAKSRHPEGWKAALLLNNVRVAGVDCHRTEVMDAFGAPLRGWHKHVLDLETGEASGRIPIADPAPDGRLTTFVRVVLEIFGVEYEGGILHEQGDLDFGP